MQREDIRTMMNILKKSYPNFYKNEKNTDDVIDIWHRIFIDDELEEVMQAVVIYISTEKFPPTIADIREKMASARTDRISVDEAWGQVKKLIRKYGYPNEEKALNEMHPAVKQLVKRFGWSELCGSENIMADRAHFMKMWNSAQAYEQEKAMIPSHIQKNLEIARKANDMNMAIDYKKEANDEL